MIERNRPPVNRVYLWFTSRPSVRVVRLSDHHARDHEGDTPSIVATATGRQRWAGGARTSYHIPQGHRSYEWCLERHLERLVFHECGHFEFVQEHFEFVQERLCKSIERADSVQACAPRKPWGEYGV